MKSNVFNLKKDLNKDLNKNLDNNLNNSTPVIFTKKLNISNIKKLKYITNDTGKIKHFTPASQEWYNSVYSYNSRYTKNLPTLDNNLMALLKEYFSMYIKDYPFNTRFTKKVGREDSANRIFIGKGDLKHSSDKVIITFYVYNAESISLKNKFLALYKTLYSPKSEIVKYNKNKKIVAYLNKPLMKYILLDDEGNLLRDAFGNETVIYNRPYTAREFLSTPKNIIYGLEKRNLIELSLDPKNIKEKKSITFYDAYSSIIKSFINERSGYLEKLNKYFEYLTNLVEEKILSNNERFLIFTKIINNFNLYKYPSYGYYKDIADKSYKKNLYGLRYLLKFNSIKFEKPFSAKLIHLIEKLYSKKIELNIVNLRKVHLSSDILTQAIALKARLRKRNIYSILESSLSKVNLPNIRRDKDRIYKFNKYDYFFNEIRNMYINNMFNKEIKGDSLNKLLLNYFPFATKLKRTKGLKQGVNIRNHLFRSLNNLELSGVRLEAKGRISKRFVASRSIFKVYWKGGLRNVDSSVKGLSAIMLRGNTRSNVEYSLYNSKVRTGAFGIKGWVGSK
jgi:hypothetical protein